MEMITANANFGDAIDPSDCPLTTRVELGNPVCSGVPEVVTEITVVTV